MSIDKTGGPAFPVEGLWNPDGTFKQGIQTGNASGFASGLSIRDWFAGQAMSGYCINAETSMQEFRDIARDAYQQADAMLAERAK